jgi:hypothetical protein
VNLSLHSLRPPASSGVRPIAGGLWALPGIPDDATPVVDRVVLAGVAVAVLAGVMLLLARVAARAVHRRRHQRFAEHAARVVILPPR